MTLQENYSLKELNTFGIDVKAKYFLSFSSDNELQAILSEKRIKDIPILILGGGSNILFTKDFNGLVLKNCIKGKVVENENEDYVFVKSGAGEVWHDFVLYCIENNFSGVENLSLIPGTVGAAPIQNIGAYGVEIKDVFEKLEAINIEDGSKKEFYLKDCSFGYRSSIFKKELKGRYVITSVTLKLSKKPSFNTSYGAIRSTLEEMGKNELSIKAISDAVIHIRKSKLPDPLITGNAGSFFKNPEIPEEQFEKLQEKFPKVPSYPGTQKGYIKIPAGWLNEQCGWKGKTVGHAGVHKKQALVLVNYGNAKGADIKLLSEAIQKSVKEKFGIKLEAEVNII